MTGDEMLEQKVAALKAEVADRVAAVEKVKIDRDVTLALRDEEIVEAEVALETAAELIIEVDGEAKLLDLNAVEIRDEAARSAARVLAQADELRENADAVPLQDLRHKVDVARRARRLLEEHWQEQLALVQDGHLRRKLSQLGKLERRLAERQATPRQRGTGLLEVEAVKQTTRVKVRTAKQFKVTLQQLTEARTKNLFRAENYKGPPEWAFLKALDRMRHELPAAEVEAIEAAVKGGDTEWRDKPRV